jgi:molecular chaperone DnaK (HSP70)
MVKSFFSGKELCKSIHADEAVAYGAAVQASLYLKNNKDNKIQIYDINPLSLGVNLIGDRMNFYITKGMQIPAKVSKKQKTVKDNQSKISFKIYQGERLFCKDNTYLGEININGLRPAPRGEVKFQITMELDENSILKVHAKEVNGDLEKDLNIQNFNDRLTKEEIEKFLKEEEMFKKEDMEKKKRVEEILKLQNFIFDIEKQIKNYNSEKKRKIQNKLSEINDWLKQNKDEDYTVYRKKIEELKTFLKNIK